MSLLANVKKDVVQKPMGVIVHSKGGLGKTTFICDAVKAYGDKGRLFQLGEDGLADLGLQGIPQHTEVIGINSQPEEWDMFKEVMKALLVEDHGLKMVAFDNMDDLINGSLMSWVTKKYYKGDTDKANAYGGACVKEMYSECVGIVSAFELMQRKGISVFVSFHSQPVTFKDPQTDNYKTWSFNVPSRDDYNIKELFFNWSSVCMFGNVDVNVDDSHKASGTQRVLFTKTDPSYNAKSRYALPAKLKFDFKTFADLVKESRAALQQCAT